MGAPIPSTNHTGEGSMMRPDLQAYYDEGFLHPPESIQAEPEEAPDDNSAWLQLWILFAVAFVFGAIVGGAVAVAWHG